MPLMSWGAITRGFVQLVFNAINFEFRVISIAQCTRTGTHTHIQSHFHLIKILFNEKYLSEAWFHGSVGLSAEARTQIERIAVHGAVGTIDGAGPNRFKTRLN